MDKPTGQMLLDGDFTALAPYFKPDSSGVAPIQTLLDNPQTDRTLLNEALACACFLGENEIVKQLLDRGIKPEDANGTGSDAFHWAVDRGNIETVRLLLSRGANTETLNRFGGTVLGAALWSAGNEPRPHHREIILLLLEAGADPNIAYPDGLGEIADLVDSYRNR